MACLHRSSAPTPVRIVETLAPNMENLLASIKHRNVVLFVGAGVSMNLGLLSWKGLISKMAEDLGFDPEHYNTLGDYLALAEYYKIKTGSLGGLRSWMDRTWHSDTVDISASEVHRLIVEIDFPIVYTTNYDNNLEVAYRLHGREFIKVVNARDLTRAPDGLPQIIKFHGDFEDDQSLVIAETDYFDRLAFDSPLDIKFRADTLGRTILFVG